MNSEIVNMIEDVYRIADNITEYSFEINMRELIRKDMINFVLFLSYIDRKITFNETGVIAYYFGYKNITPEKAIKIVGNMSSYFEEIVPDSMRIMVKYSKTIQKNNNYIENKKIPAVVLYALFKRIGKVAVSASGYPYEHEDNALKKYLLMLENFIRMELGQSISGNEFSVFDEILTCSSKDYSSPGTTDGYYFANIEESYRIEKSLGICQKEHYTLSEFIEHTPAYKNGIEDIKNEFIEKGYEKFLTTFVTSNRKATEEYILSDGDLVVNKYVSDFLKQFDDIDFSNNIVFLFPESYASNYFEAKEICKDATILRKINNIFPIEDSIHWIGVFNKADNRSITVMFHIIYSGVMGDNFGGYKLLGFGLPWYADNLVHKDTVLRSPWLPDYLAHFQGFGVQRNNPKIIMQIRQNIDYLLEQGYFNSELEIFRNLYQVLMPFLHKWFIDAKEYIANALIGIDWKTIRMKTKSKLVADGIIIPKWKHERTLYELVKKLYPDAIYQYHSSWLGKQSLDIFIPKLSIGIEYQGIQHYEPVDFFGGEEGLKKRVELDNRKKELCIKNRITLIEWNYSVEPTQSNVKKIISQVLG